MADAEIDNIEHLATSKGAVGCRQLDPAVAKMMMTIVTGRTDEALNVQFGISYNTWRKIVESKPIRRTVAQRLEHRLRFKKGH